MIIITDYQPSWPAEFERIKSDLKNVLGDLALHADAFGVQEIAKCLKFGDQPIDFLLR